MDRKVNDFEAVKIEDGRVYGLTMSYHFNVKLSEDENPAICPKVDFDGMPLEVLCKKAWEAMKVSARPSMKKLKADKLDEVYNGKQVDWRVMVSQEAANNLVSNLSLSDVELEKEIKRLQALQSARVDEI